MYYIYIYVYTFLSQVFLSNFRKFFAHEIRTRGIVLRKINIVKGDCKGRGMNTGEKRSEGKGKAV